MLERKKDTIHSNYHQMLITKDVLIGKTKEDWGENIVSSICIELMDYLIDLSHEESLGGLPFGFLCVATEWKYKVEDVLLATQYLCGDRVNLLKLCFKEENGEDIPKEKLKDYDKEKVFLHYLPSATCAMVKKMPKFIGSSVKFGDYEYWQTGKVKISNFYLT